MILNTFLLVHPFSNLCLFQGIFSLKVICSSTNLKIVICKWNISLANDDFEIGTGTNSFCWFRKIFKYTCNRLNNLCRIQKHLQIWPHPLILRLKLKKIFLYLGYHYLNNFWCFLNKKRCNITLLKWENTTCSLYSGMSRFQQLQKHHIINLDLPLLSTSLTLVIFF